MFGSHMVALLTRQIVDRCPLREDEEPLVTYADKRLQELCS